MLVVTQTIQQPPWSHAFLCPLFCFDWGTHGGRNYILCKCLFHYTGKQYCQSVWIYQVAFLWKNSGLQPINVRYAHVRCDEALGTAGWDCLPGKAVYLIHAVENENTAAPELNSVELESCGHDRLRNKNVKCNIVPSPAVERPSALPTFFPTMFSGQRSLPFPPLFFSE